MSPTCQKRYSIKWLIDSIHTQHTTIQRIYCTCPHNDISISLWMTHYKPIRIHVSKNSTITIRITSVLILIVSMFFTSQAVVPWNVIFVSINRLEHMYVLKYALNLLHILSHDGSFLMFNTTIDVPIHYNLLIMFSKRIFSTFRPFIKF